MQWVQSIAVCCNVVQCVAVCCSVFAAVAIRNGARGRHAQGRMQFVAVCCKGVAVYLQLLPYGMAPVVDIPQAADAVWCSVVHGGAVC